MNMIKLINPDRSSSLEISVSLVVYTTSEISDGGLLSAQHFRISFTSWDCDLSVVIGVETYYV